VLQFFVYILEKL